MSPSGTPTTTASRIERTPASKETWAPQMTRDRTSRPRSSVPSQLRASAGLRILDQFVAWGLLGASQGAKRAVVTKTTIITAPMSAGRRRIKRRSTRRPRRHRDRLSVGTGILGADAAVDLILLPLPRGEYGD